MEGIGEMDSVTLNYPDRAVRTFLRAVPAAERCIFGRVRLYNAGFAVFTIGLILLSIHGHGNGTAMQRPATASRPAQNDGSLGQECGSSWSLNAPRCRFVATMSDTAVISGFLLDNLWCVQAYMALPPSRRGSEAPIQPSAPATISWMRPWSES